MQMSIKAKEGDVHADNAPPDTTGPLPRRESPDNRGPRWMSFRSSAETIKGFPTTLFLGSDHSNMSSVRSIV